MYALTRCDSCCNTLQHITWRALRHPWHTAREFDRRGVPSLALLIMFQSQIPYKSDGPATVSILTEQYLRRDRAADHPEYDRVLVKPIWTLRGGGSFNLRPRARAVAGHRTARDPAQAPRNTRVSSQSEFTATSPTRDASGPGLLGARSCYSWDANDAGGSAMPFVSSANGCAVMNALVARSRFVMREDRLPTTCPPLSAKQRATSDPKTAAELNTQHQRSRSRG
ncbi:hypothetical protein GY45DRAFT_491592 [Cubamyces sp. BRFM 1775]|nr:hypothetical protein GY45DRAFT_491592 [Cubamyces sp. BRFM 1775]